MSDPRERFEDLVVEAMDGLPEWVRERLENIEVLIEDEPSPGQPNLLGRYEGIPLTRRGANYFGVLPDRITLFRRTIEEAAGRGRTDLKLPLGIGLQHDDQSSTSGSVAKAIDVLEASRRLTLDQFAEVAVALEAVITAQPQAVEPAAREWFSALATRLAHLLREQRDHHYRVAIWLDDPNYADDFVAVG